MDISNKTQRPIRVPLPDGKKLFLGPGKTGQITPKAAEHPPLLELVAAGDLEIQDDKHSSNPSGAGGDSKGTAPSQGHAPKGTIHRSGDR